MYLGKVKEHVKALQEMINQSKVRELEEKKQETQYNHMNIFLNQVDDDEEDSSPRFFSKSSYTSRLRGGGGPEPKAMMKKKRAEEPSSAIYRKSASRSEPPPQAAPSTSSAPIPPSQTAPTQVKESNAQKQGLKEVDVLNEGKGEEASSSS